jgi:uncharacterized protein (DUF2235 family)
MKSTLRRFAHLWFSFIEGKNPREFAKVARISVFERARRWWQGHVTVETVTAAPGRGAVDHVIILDGTLSTLEPGQEGNAALLFYLLTKGSRRAARSVYYEPGQQWEGWRNGRQIIEGNGVNPQIRRAYGWLASHYHPGDRIFLFGYSRGAFAVRSIAGIIDRVGLLRREYATERGVRAAFRHYRRSPNSASAIDFARHFCYPETIIQMVGVWDTVKALGLRFPWFLTPPTATTVFHDHFLGETTLRGFHALALDETRAIFAPILWDTTHDATSRVEQVWFTGAHGDIGGHIGKWPQCRPLANIPLVWMVEKAESMGLALPEGWRDHYPTNPNAPMVGTLRGFGLWFLHRRRRVVGRDVSESVHPSVALRRPRFWWFR